MQTIYASIDNLPTLNIGQRFDHQTGRVIIDCASWVRKYPALTQYEVCVTRPDGMVYCPKTEMVDGVMLAWLITDADTAIPGEGCYQVIATGKYGDRRSTYTADLIIEANMPGIDCTDPPDPSKPWVEKVLAAARAAEEAATRAEKAAETAIHQPIIGENGNWWLWDFAAGEYLDSGYPTRGE